jgi:protein involved in polysaccharide export with SLBB domain
MNSMNLCSQIDGKSVMQLALTGHMHRLVRKSSIGLLGAVLFFSCPAGAQNSPQSTPLAQDSLSAMGVPAAATDDDSSGTSGSGNLVPSQSMSANQIITILQQNPDVVDDVKENIADYFQQQGQQVSASDISDQMLYTQLQSNSGLRVDVSTFLQQRGYAPQGGQMLSSVGETASQAEPSLTPRNRVGSSTDTGDAIGQSATGTLSGFSSTSSLHAPLGTRPLNVPRRGREDTSASTDIPKVVSKPAPYNLQAMRDLYVQLPDDNHPLKRFGSDVFLEHGDPAARRGISNIDMPMDVPMGPDYVVGPGDALTINMWGGVTQSISRSVSREGALLLPEAGSLQVAGVSLRQVEEMVRQKLNQQFRNVQVSVSVSRLRSVRVYVVGDVQRPGGYDISSLATPLSALYAAGGPTAVGSLRVAKHYRGKDLVEDVDLYDLLLHGVHRDDARFESGDTLLVPPAGSQVAISGSVKRPAIYELKDGESSLDAVLQDAGGYTAAASLAHITIERVDANQRRETVTVRVEQGEDPRTVTAAFAVKDGDRIRVSPILPYSQRAVYLEGHVVRPGRLPYSDGMKLSDVLHSYQDMLPEPAARGQIIRLVAPDFHVETIDFDVPDVLIGNTSLALQPFDTVRVFGRYELDAPLVSIQGEVMEPGSYPFSKDMTAAQLVRIAGGFKRDALLESADLTSYTILNGNRIRGQVATVRIGIAVNGSDAGADVSLHAGDVLTIRQITGWDDIGQSVSVQGQVSFPGTYGFEEGSKLSDVLRRAGGFRDTAYPEGAVLVRDQVRELEEKSRDELVRQIQTNSAAARLSPSLGAGDGGSTLALIKAQQDDVLQQLKSHPATGRLVVHISADIDTWANTSADIELRRGDILTIPKRPGFVLVTGQVYNATALTFTPGKTAGWYLSHAGGTNTTANHKEIFVIRANGSVVGRHSGGWFDTNVLSTKLNPGDVVVVPQKIIGSSLFWRNLLTTAQLASSIAITAAVASL